MRTQCYGIFDRARTIDAVDVTDIQSVIDTMAIVRPDDCHQLRRIIKQLPGAQDRLLSLTLNSVLPHRLQRLCQAAGARLIHFSTDCVFSGRTGRYTEDDPSDATDLYGRTKFLGETAGAGARPSAAPSSAGKSKPEAASSSGSSRNGAVACRVTGARSTRALRRMRSREY